MREAVAGCCCRSSGVAGACAAPWPGADRVAAVRVAACLPAWLPAAPRAPQEAVKQHQQQCSDYAYTRALQRDDLQQVLAGGQRGRAGGMCESTVCSLALGMYLCLCMVLGCVLVEAIGLCLLCSLVCLVGMLLASFV